MGAVDIRKGTSSQSHLLPVLLPFPPRRWVIHIWLLGCSLALPFSSPRKGQSRDQDRAGAGWGGGNARLRQFSSQLSFPRQFVEFVYCTSSFYLSLHLPARCSLLYLTQHVTTEVLKDFWKSFIPALIPTPKPMLDFRWRWLHFS